jgi:hypothetical protein
MLSVTSNWAAIHVRFTLGALPKVMGFDLALSVREVAYRGNAE